MFLSLALLLSSGSVQAIDEPPQIHFVVKQLRVTGDNPLTPEETDRILEIYLGDHYGLEGLQSASDALERAFADKGYSFYRVTFVPQSLQDGIITFSVSQFQVDQVLVEGNTHFSEANIRRSVPALVPGETPNTRELSRSLSMANLQPSKKLKVKFTASDKENAVNASVSVTDQPPGFFFVGLNDTGTDETGRFRITGGYQYSNLFDRDHSVTLSYTSSPGHAGEVSQYGLTYSVPFYSIGSKFSLLYSNSDVDSGVVSNLFSVTGRGTVLSLRYQQTFLQWGAYKQDLEFGLSRKLFDNQLALSGVPIAGSGSGQVISRPWSVTYRASYATPQSNLDLTLGGASNIGGGTNNRQADYSLARAGATVDWHAFTYGLGFTYYFPDQWHVKFRLGGQFSNDVLIPGEQFGLGGQNSMRGLDERVLLGDKGYQANLEMWLPPVTDYQIYSLLFYDFGQVENNQPLTGELVRENPSTAGLGLRWYWKDKLTVSFDLGYVVNDVDSIQVDSNRAHIDLFYRF